MHKLIKTPSLFILALACVLLFSNCRKSKMIDISYTVTIVPLIDSLPAKVKIIYANWTESDEVSYEGTKWTIKKKCRIDTNVSLRATGVSNVKSIEVRIEGYRNPPSINQCDSTNCSVSTKYDLYGD